MPRGTSHGAARLLELELDQAGERRTQHAPRAHSPRTPIALALFMPPASVGVCRELVEMRKPSESYAKELLGLGVTVPVSLLGDEHAAAEGPHDHEPGVSQC